VTRADSQSGQEAGENDLRLSIIVPVLNEATSLADTLARLQPLRARGAEVIVVDGGSDDGSADAARPLADAVLFSRRGRASQMNAGGRVATGAVLLFLHADTRLPRDADAMILAVLSSRDRVWGRFDVRLSGDRPLLRVVEFFMNQRSRLTAIATGDQAMFVRRATFEKLGGFPALALMEDVAFSARLKRESRPLCLRARVVASSRKWEREGAVRTIWLMWRLRLAFFLGADPSDLARRYYRRDGQPP
jgi:rSAM/selenodomain-associated transferase 2